MLEGFPADRVPDSAIFAPHHYTYALIVALLLAFVVWDDYRDREPLAVVFSILFGLFGFLFVWPYYPVTGAIMSLAGLAGAGAALLRSKWGAWDRRIRIAIGVLLLVAADDALEHAFGVFMPLDYIWKVYLIPIVP